MEDRESITKEKLKIILMILWSLLISYFSNKKIRGDINIQKKFPKFLDFHIPYLGEGIWLSSNTGPCERANEADKHSQITPLRFIKFVHGVDSYDDIVDQKSKWIMNLNEMFEDVIVKKLSFENTDIKGFINFKNPNLSKSNESEYQNEFLQTSKLITDDYSFED